ncbi:GDSL esterase/lipase [Striga hermonthica]|uniref:GDSL esterase/lipase n=1 Tax=Striga hermonthica TaxID=68872 RepID=A0A9N7MYK9_STRHE|nr:GDSL esterase/lipase [Striga hermonthica]
MFTAQNLGVPLLQPYVGAGGRNFSGGVNFAVAGASALDYGFFEEIGIHMVTNASLRIQMEWFKQFLATLPGRPETGRTGGLTCPKGQASTPTSTDMKGRASTLTQTGQWGRKPTLTPTDLWVDCPERLTYGSRGRALTRRSTRSTRTAGLILA